MEEVRCESCSAIIKASMGKCPKCGAVNNNKRASLLNEPKTFEQLNEWYQQSDLSLMDEPKYYIGVLSKNPHTFSCYEVNGEYVVAESFSFDRTVEYYRGDNEEHAVYEMYQLMKQRKYRGNKTYVSNYSSDVDRVKSGVWNPKEDGTFFSYKDGVCKVNGKVTSIWLVIAFVVCAIITLVLIVFAGYMAAEGAF